MARELSREIVEKPGVKIEEPGEMRKRHGAWGVM